MTKKKTTTKEAVEASAPKPKRPPPAPRVFKYEPLADFPAGNLGVDNYSAALTHALKTRGASNKMYSPYENIHYWNIPFVGWGLFDFRPVWRGKPANVYILKTSAEAEQKAQEVNFDQTDEEPAAAPVHEHKPPEAVQEKKKKRFWFW